MGQLLQPNQQLIRHGANELFVGRAGYLCMARWMEKMLGKSVIPNNFKEILFNAIVAEGRSYSRARRLHSPLMYSYYNTEYLGIEFIIIIVLAIIQKNTTDKTI